MRNLQLGNTSEIRAPIAGRSTGQRLLHEGSLVKANDNSFTLVTINQLSPVAVTYSVPEHALDEIREALDAGRVHCRKCGYRSRHLWRIKRENGQLRIYR